MEENKINHEHHVLSNNRTSKDYVKYIPIIYPILVFLGFINYDFYYKRFDIDIFNYLNINEFLFSFVSLSYPLIFLLAAYLGLNVYSDLMRNVNDNEKTINEKDTENTKNKLTTQPEKSFYQNKFAKANRHHKEGKYWWFIGNYLLGILFFIIFLLAFFIPYGLLYIGWFLVILPLHDVMNLRVLNVENLGWFDTPTKIVSYSFAWFISFAFYLALKYNNNQISYKSFRFYIVATLSCLLISSLIRYQNLRTNYFLYKKAEKYVCFVYENENIETNIDIKLLGMTSEYLFLRDIESKTNYIYKLSNVKNLEVTSLND